MSPHDLPDGCERSAPNQVRLAGIYTGRVAPLGNTGIPSGFLKNPAPGVSHTNETGIAGDEQADLRVHGGKDKAIYAYPSAHYAAWLAEFPQHAGIWRAGSLGENLALGEGWTERDVCVGDIVTLGPTTLQVTQPRKPCFKLAARFGDDKLPGALEATGRCGWYYRVLQAGAFSAGDPLVLERRLHPAWSIQRLNALDYGTGTPIDTLRELAALPELSDAWRAQTVAAIDFITASAHQARFKPFTITKIVDECVGVKSFSLRPVDGSAIAEHRGGQHVVVRVPVPGVDAPRVRSYTVSSRPDAHTLRISVKAQQADGASAWMHRALRTGDVVELLGPRGQFVLPAAAPRATLLISAGIGITPMIAMLSSALDQPDNHRPIFFLHGARNGREHAFAETLRAHLQNAPRLSAHIRYSAPDEADVLGVSHHSAGRIDKALLADALGSVDSLGDADAYVCGPAGFTDDVIGWLLALGVPGTQIKAETFGAALGNTTGNASRLAPARANVTFKASGVSGTWARGDGNLLRLAEGLGITAPSDCRVGVCGQCKVRLLSGQVGYDAPPVAALLDDEVLLCCAIPNSHAVALAA